jgi:hypothetical protein
MDPSTGDGAWVTYWISLPGVTFSLEAKGGYIVDASVVAEWAIGRATLVALEFYRAMGANIDWITHE